MNPPALRTSIARLILEKQWLHVLLLTGLLSVTGLVTRSDAVRAGTAWGLDTVSWLWIAIGIAITHQTFVWFCWRTQLHAAWLTRAFGRHGFLLYAVGFSVLGLARVAAVFVVAISNAHTVPIPPTILRVLAIIVLIPALYLFYSVKRYFGFRRAFGNDHFDPTYRDQAFERRGIFRFTCNGMYVYGFLLLWVPALWWGSGAGLWVAAFNHLYIWVHYAATERPDIARIYGAPDTESGHQVPE